MRGGRQRGGERRFEIAEREGKFDGMFNGWHRRRASRGGRGAGTDRRDGGDSEQGPTGERVTAHERRVRQGAMAWLGVSLILLSCARAPQAQVETPRRPMRDAVAPGITVLLEDSLSLIAGKRIALLTNQTGVNAQGVSDVDLLHRDARARSANVRLVRIFAPEHGFRGTADVQGLPDELDARTGLMIHSLYGRETSAPPDSLLRDIDALVFDLQDIGTRTWTYVGLMVYAMRAAERAGIPFVVLDRPNPLGGRTEAPFLDSALANPNDPTAARRGQAYALYPTPLRHGMTMAELAQMFVGELGLGVRLQVVPMRGWRRGMSWDDTGLPWVVPSPAMVSTTSAQLYPALVAFEQSNLSVGRGTDRPFQRFGAPWLNADSVVALLRERSLAGLRFDVERFTPTAPTDNKFGGQSVRGVRIVVEDPERVQAGRLGATILWAVARTNGDSLRLNNRGFDLRFGDPAAREALLGAGDPDEVIDQLQPALMQWQQRMRRYHLYR